MLPKPGPLRLRHSQLRTAVAAGYPLEALTGPRALVVTPTGKLHDPTCATLHRTATHPTLDNGTAHPSLSVCTTCVMPARDWRTICNDVTTFAVLADALSATTTTRATGHATARTTGQLLIAAEHLAPAALLMRQGRTPDLFLGPPASRTRETTIAAAYDVLCVALEDERRAVREELTTQPGYRPAYVLVHDHPATKLASPASREVTRRAALALAVGKDIVRGPSWSVVASPWEDFTPWNELTAAKHAVALAGTEGLPDGIWTAFATIAAGHTTPDVAFATALTLTT